jgi:holliday junction DNA helicase RuvA
MLELEHMIAKLKGKIEYLKDNYAVMDVHDVGYKVFLSVYTFGKVAGLSAKVGEVSLFIYTYVREDTLALYGFLTLEELEMFELLISISGIGPKAGMGILSIATPKTIRTAIINEDPSILTRVSGIGKKTAGRVILELKNKVADLSVADKDEVASDTDAIEALLTMGYSVSDARDALKLVPVDVKDIGARIKEALKRLGKK